MYCKNCGNNLNQGEKFCTNCGTRIDNIQNQQGSINNINTQIKSSWKNTVALVIGIISLVLVFIFQIFTIPLSIVGIVFGILSLKNNKKHFVGLILNIASLVLAVPILIFYSFVFDIPLYNQNVNPAVGIWNCKSFNNGNFEELDYIISMELDNDYRFKWSKYNDGSNNYVVGNYEFKDLNKTNNAQTADYYSIKLIGDKYVSDGVIQTEKYSSEYEIGILRDSNEAIMINPYTYNMYYCYRNTNK